VKLAVSNIAWPREEDAAVAEVLNASGISGIEIAPTKIWPDSLTATESEIDAYRRFWNDRGISIVAAQALLFGQADLTLFEAAAVRQKTLAYLGTIVRLCGRLGARALVFGSPKNRKVGSLPAAEADAIAQEFFGKLGEIAAQVGSCIVMEANPPEYGADFATHAAAAIELVERVDHPGFRLHLDTGCMTLAGDPIPGTFDRGFRWLEHFHVSEPNLDPPVTSGKVNHAAFAEELTRRNYRGWVSLEMREPKPFNVDGFRKSLQWLMATYNGRVQS
jgi:sugar phosphate isomerase/epimerase